MSTTHHAPPTPNTDFSAEDSPLWTAGFRYYVPTADPEWTPLVILGFQVNELGERGPGLGTSPGGSGWYGEAAFSPLIWEPADTGRPFLRALHQCGGLSCLQRAVVGVPLWAKPLARRGVARALAALQGGDEPTFSALLEVQRQLAPSTGLDLERTFRRCVESFMVIDLPDDTQEAGRAIANLFKDDLPGDLGELFVPRADALASAKGQRIPRTDLRLFVLDANED